MFQRRVHWASFWMGQGVGDIITQKIWKNHDEKKESDGADYSDEKDDEKLESSTKYNTKKNEMTEKIMSTVDLESVCDSKQFFVMNSANCFVAYHCFADSGSSGTRICFIYSQSLA